MIMRKVKLFTMLLTALLVSGGVWGTEYEVSDASGMTSALSSAQNGDVIKLTSSFSMSSTSVPISKSITLDLNGFILGGTNKKLIEITNGATLTIKNSDLSKQGKIKHTYSTSSSSYYAIYITNGNLVINESGNSNGEVMIESKHYDVVYSNYVGANITLNSNTIINSTKTSNGGRGVNIVKDATMTVQEGVSFNYDSGDATFIPIQSSYPLTLTSYCIDFPKTKINNNNNAVTINNYGTISEGNLVSYRTSAGQANVVTLNNYGDVTFKEIFAHRLTLNNKSGATCSIESGAQFLGTVMNIDNKGTMTITDGFFNANTFSFTNTGTFSITGGTMTNQAYAALENEIKSPYTTIVYALSASENGRKILTQTEFDNYEYKAEVEGVQYATFETAINAANASVNSNLTVNLLQDDQLSFAKINVGANISKINFNGHSLTGTSYINPNPAHSFVVDGGGGSFTTNATTYAFTMPTSTIDIIYEFKNITINHNITSSSGSFYVSSPCSIILDNVTINETGTSGLCISTYKAATTANFTFKNNVALNHVSSDNYSYGFRCQGNSNTSRSNINLTIAEGATVVGVFKTQQSYSNLTLVNNGTINNMNHTASTYDFNLTNNGTIIFTGGNQYGTVTLNEGTDATTLLKGGNYRASAHTAYQDKVAPGYAWNVVTADTEWSVVDNTSEVALYDGTIYSTLEVAISAAIADSDPSKAVLVLKPLNLSETLSINGNVTIDLNGNNISFTNNYFELAGGSLNVVNSGAAAKISNTNGMAVFVNNYQANLTVGANVTIDGTSNAILVQKAGVLSLADATLVSANDKKDILVRNYIDNATLGSGQTMELEMGCRYNSANDAVLSTYKVAGSKTIFQRFAPYGEVKCVVAADAIPQAAIGSYMYLGMTDAIANVQSGETIVLQTNASNINISGQRDNITDGKQVTVDLNGHLWDVMSGMEINDGSLNIIGTGSVTTSKIGYTLFIVRGASTNEADYSTLTIGQNVTLVSASGCYAVSVYGQTDYTPDVYGAVVNFDGTINGKSGSNTCNGLYVNGNNQTADVNSVQMNIGSHAVITVPNYAAGYAKWTIADGASISASIFALEIRAGELTINGGSYTGTYNTISCNPNGNGSTTTGAAIAIAQHTTKQPVIVTINGGEFRAPMAMIQVNPQNNTEADYRNMIVNVNGGRFWSDNGTAGMLFENQENYGTVYYAEDEMFISQNRRIFLRGGYYNYDPIKFVAVGYQRIKLEDIPEAQRTAEDLAAIAAEYVYKIGEIKPEDAVETTDCDNCINWKNDADDLWSDHEVPTDATPVVIKDKEVIITTPANAYSVTLENTGSGGTTKLTIKDGGMLMVGSGGVTGADSLKFIVEDGGMLCIAPNASEYEKPEGTVIVSSDYARRKDTEADAKTLAQLTGDDLYWRHIACPTVNDNRTLTISKKGCTYINTWDLLNGWTSKGANDWKTPFIGYNISTTLLSTTRESDTILYTFKGELAGNKVETLKFSRIGFTFFGNSYLAPIDIRELLTSLDVNDDVESTVILYKYDEEIYEYVNRAAFALPWTTAEIAPLQGFFVFSEKKSTVDYNYTKAVWDAFCAKARAVEFGAPARKQTMDHNFDAIACVQLTSINGKRDKLYLFEGADYSSAFDKGYDARKMNTSGMHIAALDADNELAIIATDNLEGTALTLTTGNATDYTLSFSNVSGKALAIYDVLTDVTTNMVEGATYSFSADANTTIDNRFRVVNARQTPTDMESVNAAAAAKGVYTILGEYLGESDVWMTLPSGVYIVNGEKMVR